MSFRKFGRLWGRQEVAYDARTARNQGRDGIKPAVGPTGEQLGAHAGNGLDVSA